MIIISCKICSKTFKRREYDVKRRPSLFCSVECSNRSRTIKLPEGEQWCSRCKVFKDNSNFSSIKKKYCRKCNYFMSNRWNIKHKEQYLRIRTNRHLQLNYGLSLVEYEILNEKQKGQCKICGNESNSKRLAVDHDHETGKIRGLLCFACNVGIGKFKHKKEYLLSAIEYLK